MQPLVECVPNFSEGRRPEVVEAILNSIRGVRGVTILDHSLDADHNRSVLTFVGDPEAIELAAFEAIKTAASLIDLNMHQGEHPRIGAADVVPFIPIRDVQMADCVAISKRLGQRVADELGIPVYLYEQAATRPERQNLENIRKGEYEGLKEAIQNDPDRTPDFGPSELGTAGATVIGARAPLVAYNLYLNTNDVAVASKIARSIRHSGGGLRFVKALGLLVDGKAQVSMNLTDFTKTPIHRVQEIVKTEASRYGCTVTHSELVGLIPEQALFDTARWYLQLDLFTEDQILERKLTAAEQDNLLPERFIDAVASGAPTPGGGAVAALAGALAAGLAAMVARSTIGKKKYAEVEAVMQEVAAATDALRSHLTRNITEDSQSFEEVLSAFRLSKEDESRSDAIQSATLHASEVPLKTAQLALDCMNHLAVVVEKGNANAVTDAAAGIHMAQAAIEVAVLNVQINLKGLTDVEAIGRLQSEVDSLLRDSRSLSARILKNVEKRMGAG